MVIKKGIYFWILVNTFQCAASVNVTLPDGRIESISDPESHRYILNSTEMDSSISISRNYLLIEMNPNTAFMCPKGYHIFEIKQELIINPNSSSTAIQTLDSASILELPGGKSAPCPTLYLCLGYQACTFKFGNEFCRKDAAPNLRKMLLVAVLCQKDTYNMFPGESKTLERKWDMVLHLRYHSRLDTNEVKMHKNYNSTSIMEYEIPESEVFETTCPDISGYEGECIYQNGSTTEAPWFLLSRTKSKVCRTELLQVFCAFQHNNKGMCMPPFLLKRDEITGTRKHAYASLPNVGKRISLNTVDSSEFPPELNQVRMGFMLLLHKDISTAMTLINTIWKPEHFYVVHVDKRAVESRKVIERAIFVSSKYSRNMHLLPVDRSFETTWGSYEIVRAELECMEELLRIGLWDFTINLSGADLPLRSVDDLTAALAPYRGLNFLPFIQLQNKVGEKVKQTLADAAFYSCDDYVYRVAEIAGYPDPNDFEIHNSPQWGVFSREFVEYLVDEDQRSDKINNYQFYLQTRAVPDESYIATILMNSPFRSSARSYPVHVSKEFVSDNADHLCRHSTDADFCGQGPSLYDENDKQELMSYSHRSFFARKFSSDMKDKARLFTRGLPLEGYNLLVKMILPPEIVRVLAHNAISQLMATRGKFLRHDLAFKSVNSVRIFPALEPHDDCCQSPLLSKLRKITDHRMWMDILFADDNEYEKTQMLRVSLKPTTNGRNCHNDGDLKMTFLTTWTKNYIDEESISLGLQETMPFPYGPAGISSVTINLVFARSNFSCSDDDEDRSRPLILSKNSTNLIFRLFSPSNEVECVRRESIFFSNNTNENDNDEEERDEVFSHVHTFSFGCNNKKMGAGPWLVQFSEEEEASSSRVYNLPFYLLDYENRTNIESHFDDVCHLWSIEVLAVLPHESEHTRSMLADLAHSSVKPSLSSPIRFQKIFTKFLLCNGGLLWTVMICTLLQYACCHQRIHFRHVFINFVIIVIASVIQAILLLYRCWD